MQYKISIIIPIYNIEKYLEQTLDSLVRQTIGHKNLEVLMINDCSNDGSGEIMDKYARKYDSFTAVHLTENCGLPGKPRNIGLEMARGEYLMFMDHDDYYSDDACEVLYNRITAENADMGLSRFFYVYENGRTRKNPTLFGNAGEIRVKNVEEDERLLRLGPALWTKIFRRNFILDNDIRFPEGILAEDLSFLTHSFLKADGIVYLNNYFSYNYRIRNSDGDKSTIHIRSKKYLMAMIKGYYDTYNILKKLKKEYYYPVIFKNHLNYFTTCFILSDAEPSEKMELLNEMVFFYKKLQECQIELDKDYLPLVNSILNKKFDDAVLISEVMAIFKKKEIKTRENYQRKNKKFKKRVAELQTTKGWLNYKIRNIIYRLKRKIKT